MRAGQEAGCHGLKHETVGDIAGSFSRLIELMRGEGFRFVSCRDFYTVRQRNGWARRREGSWRKGGGPEAQMDRCCGPVKY